MFATKAARGSILFAVMLLFGLGILYFAGFLGHESVTAQQFVNLQEGEQPHAGFRRAHAKGICIAGTFESTGALAPYSIATVFKQGATPFSGRFSIAGNNPTAPDLKAPVRSLAFALLNEDNQEWRVAMNTPPVMAVATPDAFFAQIQALSPDPLTKQRDPKKISAFFTAHPETQAFNDWRASYVPTDSFATERYHSINAFYLVNKKGEKQAVRWVAAPQVANGSSLALDIDSPDALQKQLIELLENEPVKFSMIFTLADETDDENNPTIPWPEQRKQINAGTLTITHWEAQELGQCEHKLFDPLVLPNGIEATADPILRARSAAYAESFRRRARETLLATDTQSE